MEYFLSLVLLSFLPIATIEDFLFFIVVPAGAVAAFDLLNNPAKKRLS